MKTLTCDICKTALINPIEGRTYWHIREYDICESCKDTLHFKLRPVIRQHVPYSQGWYEHELITLIEKSIKAGVPV